MNPQLLHAEVGCRRRDLLAEAAARALARGARGRSRLDLAHRVLRAYQRLWWASRPRDISLAGLLVMSCAEPRRR